MKIDIQFESKNGRGLAENFHAVQNRLQLRFNGEFGTAIKELDLTVYVGIKAGTLSKSENFGQLPRKRYRKAQGALSIKWFVRKLSEKQCLGKPTLKSLNLALDEVLAAMLYIEEAIGNDVDFDFPKFNRTCRKVLGSRYTSINESKKERELVEAKTRKEWNQWFRGWLKNPELEHWVESFEGGLPGSKYPHRLYDDQYMIPGLTEAQRLKFYQETSWIHNWYSKLLARKYRGASGRLSIDYIPPKLKREVPYPAGLYLPFDLAEYRAGDEFYRRKLMATTLRDGLVWWAKKLKQDPSPVKVAFEEIKKSEFRFQGEFKNKFLSPDKKMQARVVFDYGPKGMEMFVVFTKPRSNTELCRVGIGKQTGHAWLIFYSPVQSKWQNKIFHVGFVGWKGKADAKAAYAKLRKS